MPDLKHLTGIILILLLFSCAQTSPLTGGPRDTYAPTIDSAKTYPYNGQTNFADQQVKMKFNEYIKLNNPLDNILIIPQMETKPTIEAKNKRLTITFNEPLQENTTYSITFNHAIQDITESNDSVFQYVFSTGNYIDSLQITGKVKDAFTNQDQKEMLVALYPKTLEANFDSIPLKFKPTYLTQTDATGNFKMNYLKDGVYYIFSFHDKNKNLQYDLGEALAFSDEKEFALTPDETFDFELNAFTEKAEDVYLKRIGFSYPGKVEVVLSNPTDSFRISSNIPLLEEATGTTDSLVFWLEKSPVPKMRFYIELLGEKDTLKPIYNGIPEKEESVKLAFTHNVVQGNLLPKENLRLTLSEPIAAVDTGGISFFAIDSAEVKMDSILIDLREITFVTFGSQIERIVIDSGAISSIYGHINTEKIALTFANFESDYYGSLIVTLDTVFSVPVIVHLINDKGDLITSANFESKMRFDELLPGNYQLRLIFDVDGNGEWTSGSLQKGQIPESVIYNSESINVKSKWEKEVDWQIKKEE